jgi:hypothetical protein
MGLLDKTNPRATRRSVLLKSTVSAVVGAIVFLLAFKPAYRAAWRVALPIWVLLCAGVGALWEWQVRDESDVDDNSH